MMADAWDRAAQAEFEDIARGIVAMAEAAIEKGDIKELFEIAPQLGAVGIPDQLAIKQKARLRFKSDFSPKAWEKSVNNGALLDRGKRPEVARAGILAGGLNDVGNAQRLVLLYGEEMRYSHEFRKWLVWDGRRWAVDGTGQAIRNAKCAMAQFLKAAIDERVDAAEKFAVKSLDARRIDALLSLAESDIYVEGNTLDSDPMLLNVMNGTVDLRTGILRPHDRGDMITKLVHHPYEPSADCPTWRKFLEEIMGGGPDAGDVELERADRLLAYLQRAIGYSLTGNVNEKAVFVLFGSGNNGKSTMLATVRELIREYAVLIDVNTLMVKQESNNTQADLADLRGARFAQTSEVEEGQRLAQGKLKRITQGMGTIKACRKYENPIEFTESHKLWMDTNRKPVIKDGDDRATFNRLHSIPFTVSIPSERIDRELPRKLLAEAPGILAWMVEGARLWHQFGLEKPPEVQRANDEWKAESDQIGRFIDECCVIGDEVRGSAGALYDAYRKWAEHCGEIPVPQKLFGPKLVDRGFEKVKGNSGARYVGVTVATGGYGGPSDG